MLEWFVPPRPRCDESRSSPNTALVVLQPSLKPPSNLTSGSLAPVTCCAHHVVVVVEGHVVVVKKIHQE